MSLVLDTTMVLVAVSVWSGGVALVVDKEVMLKMMVVR